MSTDMIRRDDPPLKVRLGFCSECWRRAVVDAEVKAHSETGEIVYTRKLKFCGKHLDKAVEAMTAGPHEGEIQFEEGSEIESISWEAQ